MATGTIGQQDTLATRLAAVLPTSHHFGIYHLSTPPTRTDALYAPLPNQRPDKTFCESHFLAISIDASGAEGTGPESQNGDSEPKPKKGKKSVLVLALEVLVFSTAHTTTLFVSKADSSGFLHLLTSPSPTAAASIAPSPIRAVTSAFVSFLVDKRKRPNADLVVSLFARSQDQYLFPGSIEYAGKHLLDDRALVRWWCRVLDPLVQRETAKGYLLVPGLEEHETRALTPRPIPSSGASSLWTVGHPLLLISPHHRSQTAASIPPRCLIPRFPDDPKSRFRDELDEEAAGSSGLHRKGVWKSVSSLDTFWEMMAFRQECSSGRMTGFIWVVFPAKVSQSKSDQESSPTQLTIRTAPSAEKKLKPKEKKKKKKKSRPNGPIVPREPRIKTSVSAPALARIPTETAHYIWPPAARGARVVREPEYKRIVELLLHLDFSTRDKAFGSTARWLGEIGTMEASSPSSDDDGDWGWTVTGEREVETKTAGSGQDAAPAVNNLNGLVKRKRTSTQGEEAKVNVLSSGLLKKKPKA